jgi:molybdate transport system ATP-binding protein
LIGMPLLADLSVRRSDLAVEISCSVGDGETLGLLGPNGSGKSTVVEALAGLVPLAAGSIRLDGRAINPLPPERRPIGVAFQDGLLFPHMSAVDNVAYPLRARGTAARAARERARALLARLAPSVRPDSRPDVLSGGERQRVALARALAPEPRLLLLDEPLSAVDVRARMDLRRLLREVTSGFAGPCILVAHDPVDALTLADRIAILEAGRLVQTGTPDEIRRVPLTPYAADLVGVNLFQGTLEPLDDGSGRLSTSAGAIVVAWPQDLERAVRTEVLATVRPADVALHIDRPAGSPRNVLEGGIVEVAVHGERARVRLASVPPVVAEVTLGSVRRLGLREDMRAFASFKAVEVALLVPSREPGTLGP